MIKNSNINDSKLTLDNSAIQLMRKESKDSWYRYTLEDEGSMTPVSMNDELPLNMLDTKIKYRTFRNLKTKTLLETTNSLNPRDEDVDYGKKLSVTSKEIQDSNDIEK